MDILKGDNNLFTTIKDEVTLLINDLNLMQGILIDEQNELANNACAYIKYEGMISQIQSDIERAQIAQMNIDLFLEDIMKNAIDGNYSAKMEILERENQLLRDKIDMFEQQAKTIENNLNKENKKRAGKSKKEDKSIEENLEL